MLYLKLLLYFFSTLFSFKRSLKDTEQRQIEKFRKIFEHARANSPFYRELYHNSGLDDLVIKTKEDIEKVPVIDKNMMRKYTEEQLLTCSPNEKNLHSHYTSGSTGVPFKIVENYYEAFCSHVRVFVMLLRCGWRPWDSIFMYARYEQNDKFDIEKKLSVLGMIQKRLHLFERKIVSIYTPPEKVWQEMIQSKPDFIWATPGVLDILCTYMQKKDLHFKVKCILLIGSNISDGQYRNYVNAFHATIISHYGLMEFPTIGYYILPQYTCHLFSDFIYLEKRNTVQYSTVQYSTVQYSTVLIATNLENFTMPFIRFNTNDAVETLDDKSFLIKKIGKIYGRNNDSVTLKSGVQLVHTQTYEMFMDFHECLQYKFVQYSNGDVALRLNVAENADKNMVKQKALERWHRRFPNDELKIEFTGIMDISLKSGKFKTLEKLDV